MVPPQYIRKTQQSELQPWRNCEYKAQHLLSWHECKESQSLGTD